MNFENILISCLSHTRNRDFSPFPPATSFIINEHNGQHWTGNYAGQVSKPKSLPPASFPREKTKLLGEKTKLPGEKTKLPGEKTKLTGEKTKFARGNKHGEHHGQVQVGVAAVEEPGHVPPARPRQLLHAVAEQPRARQHFYRFGVLCKIWPLFRGIYLPLPFTLFPSNVQFRAKAFRVNYVSWNIGSTHIKSILYLFMFRMNIPCQMT